MTRLFFVWGVLAMAAAEGLAQPADRTVLVVHGGAGAEPKDKITPAKEKAYRDGLERALQAGRAALLKPGGTSLDAVEAAIIVLEDDPIFNAGRGAVFNREGRNELNASIMDGQSRKAGAIAGVARVKNPITAARAVMEKSPHVFLIGEGAERFARDQGITMVSPLYFWTEYRWNELKAAEAKAAGIKTSAREADDVHFGTVGAVAIDAQGNLAAGTSTGGITYVMPGRVGDSPILGAGTIADNASCAVSCTGVGELFIRHSVAHDISARIKYKGESANVAAQTVLDGLPKRDAGVGGIIVLDRHGVPAIVFNTNAMQRGTITQGGTVTTGIYEK
ncbi:MAG: isoaspartyl peptidase/L-asparaginase [Planctomycetota bacterium]|jgi:beta-aspartyl-peptidase (threonine type)